MPEFQTHYLGMASILAGCSIGFATIVVSQILNGRRRMHGEFEESRREILRRSSGLYCRLEPLVDEVAQFFPENHSSDMFAHHLKLIPELPDWKPAEFLAVKTIEAVLIGLAIFAIIGMFGMPWLALGFALATSMTYPAIAKSSVINRAKSRMKKLKLRMPFAVDQISLMMAAGAGFEDSLKTVVGDNREHPLSQELSEVVRQMSLGRPRSQALSGFRDRMGDDDISEVVFAIIKGEELGTPLSNILREQANQMRLKRSQWGEKAASEAEVQMVFPGMITMVACLLVIIAPILLPVVITMLEN